MDEYEKITKLSVDNFIYSLNYLLMLNVSFLNIHTHAHTHTHTHTHIHTHTHTHTYIYIYIQSASENSGCGLFTLRIYEEFHINL